MNPKSEKQPRTVKVPKTSDDLTWKTPAKSKKDAQPFDNFLKTVFQEAAGEIVSEWVEEVEFVASENVELDRSKLKADIVLKIRWRSRRKAVVNFELQAAADPYLIYRVLQYIAALYARYRCLIIVIVVYLFRCQTIPPVHTMEDESGEFGFSYKIRVVRLWEEDPEPIVASHFIAFYTLLPEIKNPRVDLLKQALREMAEFYSQDELRPRLMWFAYMVRRTDTMSEEDKQIIEEELNMLFTYQEIIKDDPVIQKALARAKADGMAEAAELAKQAQAEAALAIARAQALAAEEATKAKAEGMKDAILNMLNIRFSSALANRAKPAIKDTHSYDVLNVFFRQLVQAPDEQAVSLVLGLSNGQSNSVPSAASNNQPKRAHADSSNPPSKRAHADSSNEESLPLPSGLSNEPSNTASSASASKPANSTRSASSSEEIDQPSSEGFEEPSSDFTNEEQ